jgi:hypothetical protein
VLTVHTLILCLLRRSSLQYRLICNRTGCVAASLENSIRQHCSESRPRTYSLFCCVSWDTADERRSSTVITPDGFPALTFQFLSHYSPLQLTPYSVFNKRYGIKLNRLRRLVKPSGLSCATKDSWRQPKPASVCGKPIRKQRSTFPCEQHSSW